MTNTEHIEAVLAWISEILPEVGTSTYDYAPAGKAKELPDAVGELKAERVVQSDERFKTFQLQQLALRVFEINVSLMVDNGTDEAGGAAAAGKLREFAEALTISVLNEPTLKGRVAAASPLVEFDYSRPFVEYPDGTRGREVAMSIAVCEPVVAAD